MPSSITVNWPGSSPLMGAPVESATRTQTWRACAHTADAWPPTAITAMTPARKRPMMWPLIRGVDHMKARLSWTVTCFVLALGLAAATIHLRGQQRPPDRGWTAYGADNANTHYSPLDQIMKDNFNKLEVAWRFK